MHLSVKNFDSKVVLIVISVFTLALLVKLEKIDQDYHVICLILKLKGDLLNTDKMLTKVYSEISSEMVWF